MGEFDGSGVLRFAQDDGKNEQRQRQPQLQLQQQRQQQQQQQQQKQKRMRGSFPFDKLRVTMTACGGVG
jgi:hypothetical protein